MLTLNSPDFVGKEPKKAKKKKPTGILKDLIELKRYLMEIDPKKREVELHEDKNGGLVDWSDVEAIIKKYSNP
jgi:hypothetical protein